MRPGQVCVIRGNKQSRCASKFSPTSRCFPAAKLYALKRKKLERLWRNYGPISVGILNTTITLGRRTNLSSIYLILETVDNLVNRFRLICKLVRKTPQFIRKWFDNLKVRGKWITKARFVNVNHIQTQFLYKGTGWESRFVDVTGVNWIAFQVKLRKFSRFIRVKHLDR